MKIKGIEINNFGPFYGKHQIEFESGVNITFGENGSGKTFLFKALGFALYGTLFTKVNSESINRRYLTQGGNQAAVTINFELLERQYAIERSILKNGTTKVKLLNGKGESIEDIYQKIPPHTAPFFLLDGEEVRQWVMSIGKTKWDTASVLGLGIYQAVLSDLNELKINLEDRINDIEQRSGIISMRSGIKSINEDINNDKKIILKIKRDIIKIGDATNNLKKLRSYVKSYIKIRETNKRLRKLIKEFKDKNKADLKHARARAQLYPYSIIKEQFYNALELIEHMKNVSFDARLEQGRLDAQMELLGGIFQTEECVCGRPLAASKFGKNSISDLVVELNDEMNKFEKAAKAEYWPTMDLMEMRSKVDLSERAATELDTYLKNIKNRKATLKIKERENRNLIIELHRIEKEVLNLLNYAKIKFESKRWQNIENINQMILKNERERGIYKGQIVAYQNIINGKNKEIKKINKKMKKTLLIERERINQLKDEQNNLQRMINEVEAAVKNSIAEVLILLEEKVEDIFKKITNKPREFIKINFSRNDGTPRIITDDGNVLSMNDISDGERQVVMFSLISALKNMSPAEVLVVDGPFGRLDSKHIGSIITFLPSIAPQTILFLTDREFQEINKSKILLNTWHIVKEGKGNKLELIT